MKNIIEIVKFILNNYKEIVEIKDKVKDIKDKKVINIFVRDMDIYIQQCITKTNKNNSELKTISKI